MQARQMMRRVAACWLAAIVLAACGGGDDCLAGASAFACVAAERAGACNTAAGSGQVAIVPPVVRYEVTGTAASVDLTLENERGDTVQFAATVPWAMAFHGTTDQWVYVSARNNDPTGTIRVRLTIDGQVKVDQSSAEPYGIAGDGVFCC